MDYQRKWFLEIKKLKRQVSVYNINKNLDHESISEFERCDFSLLSTHVAKMVSSSVSSSEENVLVKKVSTDVVNMNVNNYFYELMHENLS